MATMSPENIQRIVMEAMADYNKEVTQEYGDEMVASMTVSGIQLRLPDCVSTGQIVYAVRQLVKDESFKRLGKDSPRYVMAK